MSEQRRLFNLKWEESPGRSRAVIFRGFRATFGDSFTLMLTPGDAANAIAAGFTVSPDPVSGALLEGEEPVKVESPIDRAATRRRKRR